MLRLLLDTLTKGPRTIDAPVPDAASIAELAARVAAVGRDRLGRSLSIREVDEVVPKDYDIVFGNEDKQFQVTILSNILVGY